MDTFSVVIAKPTKLCNADCAYCAAPPDGKSKWRFEDFKKYFDKLEPYLHDNANWIWHGGEPMLLGPKFYQECHDYAKSKKPNIRFSMQTNILIYDSVKWKDLLQNCFPMGLSTSFDPDLKYRTLGGNTQKYADRFWLKLNEVVKDGFHPMVIGVYTEDSVDKAMFMYEDSLSRGDNYYHIRFNYCYPAGRAAEGFNEAITPKTYGTMLLNLYNRWIKDLPNFTITPLDQMFRRVIGENGEQCPWTRKCGGKFLGLEPNGDLYNCDGFADLKRPDLYSFGNLNRDDMKTILNTKPLRLMKRRNFDLPIDCKSCEHFNACSGGCMRDAELYNHGLGGKFHYCESWKMVLTRIKESILTGEANGVIEKMGYNPEVIRNQVKEDTKIHFDFNDLEIENIILNGSNHPLGFFDNYLDNTREKPANRIGKMEAIKIENRIYK